VNANIRRQLQKYKRRIKQRLDRNILGDCSQPMFSASNIHYEIAERTRGIAAGGIGLMHKLVKRLGLDDAINRNVQLLKLHLPYFESDHVLNIAYNLLAGGACLEHLELLRNDEAYLDALGTRRIPDPTTAGDFCRRLSRWDVFALQEAFNEVRLKVWRQQPAEFFEQAIIDGDGTQVVTTGECKQGMDIDYKGQWGYQVLLISLANTGEPLYLLNRSGNRPSHEGAAAYFDRGIDLCRRAGFRRIAIRGDTDFTQTKDLDRWHADGVEFCFGIDAMSNLYEIAESLPKTAWQPLERPPKYQVKTQPRRRPQNVKRQIVIEREYENIRLAGESVAEFRYSPTLCDEEYRVVVVWKDLEIHKGQLKLFDKDRCFFYITNDEDSTPAEIVRKANQRCNQENTIQQLAHGAHALQAPVDNLVSNWAYMVMASLAWSLKAWAALSLPEQPRHREKHREEKRKLLTMDFSTFRNALINIPAQIVRTSRRIVYRLLSWNPWQPVFFRLLDQLNQPLRY
jgi:hypothetical protein